MFNPEDEMEDLTEGEAEELNYQIQEDQRYREALLGDDFE